MERFFHRSRDLNLLSWNKCVLLIFMLEMSGSLSHENVDLPKPDSLIYDSRNAEFVYGLAIPGEVCYLPDKEKKEWKKLIDDKVESTRSFEAKYLLRKICGIWMGYYCDEETERCECSGENLQWEANSVDTQGCHALVGAKCDGITQCVSGAECSSSAKSEDTDATTQNSTSTSDGPTTVDPKTVTGVPPKAKREVKVENDTAVEKSGGGTCVCKHPGFRNCSESKEMAYNVDESVGRNYVPSAYLILTLILLRPSANLILPQSPIRFNGDSE